MAVVRRFSIVEAGGEGAVLPEIQGRRKRGNFRDLAFGVVYIYDLNNFKYH